MHSLQAKALPFRRTAGSLYSGLQYDFFSLFVFLAVNESIKCTFAEQNMECQLCRNDRTSEILQKTMRSTLHNRPKCIQVDLHLLHIQQPPTTTAIVVVGGCLQYQQKAEENLAAVMKCGNYSRREKLLLIGEWLSKRWWLLLLCLAPALLSYSLIPFVVSNHGQAILSATSILFVGLILVCNHLVSYLAKSTYALSKDAKEFRVLMIMRIVWLTVLGVSLFVSIELGLSTLYAMTPAGSSDGYAITSIFYDILIPDHGNYLDNCWSALKCALWQCFSAIVINIDLSILWMKRK